MLKDLWPGTDFSHPRNLSAAPSGAYRAADDGIHGRELWWSEGTEGTNLADGGVDRFAGHQPWAAAR